MPFLHRALERTRPHWVRCLFLVLLGFAVRFPALSGDLIWDDASLVRDNPLIKSPLLFGETFRHYLALDGSSPHYRPIQNISYFFDYLIWNADPFGYHLSNLFWHIGSGVLLYFLLLRLLQPFRDRFAGQLISGAAFLVALFWIVHPVHSAAVDYISGRADSLGFFFACAGWLVYAKARSVPSRPGRSLLHAAAGALALTALCARETGCVWMLLFLFHLFVFHREESWRSKLSVAAVCLALVAIYAGLRQLPSEHLLPSGSVSLPFAERLTLMMRALGDYARLMIFPSNLHVERTVRASTDGAGGLLLFYGIVAAAALAYGTFRKGKAQPIRALGAAWFILAFLPISNLFTLNATVAEHWLYLPSVGLLIFIAGAWLELPAHRHVVFLAAAGCIALVGLSARSFVRSSDWVNSETFYSRSLAAGASKTRFVLNLAQTYAARKDYARAEDLLRTLVATNPHYAMGQNALAHLLLEEGRKDEAQQIFAVTTQAKSARSDQPRDWIAALNLAYMKYSGNDAPAALAILEKARSDFPGTWRLISFESEILRATGESERALGLVRKFRETNWWNCAAAIEMGRIYFEQRRYAEAEVVLRRASWLDIHDVESLNLIAALNLEQDRLEAACDAQRSAVRRQPDQPRQYFLLADILNKMGRSDEARAALVEVRQLQALAKAK